MNKKNNSQLKTEAIKLRKKGQSYGEIGNKLGIAKSTLSFWLKNIPLSSKDKKRLYANAVLNLCLGPRCQKERRKREVAKIIKDARKEIQWPLSWDTYQLVGAAIYWAEGSKTGGFEVANSDPYLILFMVGWFEKVFGVSPKNLNARLNIYSQQNDKELKQFWSQLTAIPLENFGKSFVKPPNKGYKKNNLYYGTIKIRAPKGTDMRHRTFGWIKAMLGGINPKTELIQREWRFLKEVQRPINLPKK